MNSYIVLAQCTLLVVRVSSEKLLPVSNTFRDYIALEVLKVSPVNTVVSPLALKLPLCKLASIAQGETKTELMSVLGIDRESGINCFSALKSQFIVLTSAELMMHNRIYVNDSLELNRAFPEDSHNEWGVRVGKIGFKYPQAAFKVINRWAATDTLFRISNLIDEDEMNINTSVVLLSGLHYKGHWESPFNVRFTKYERFRDDTNKPMDVQMMRKVGSFQYFYDIANKFKALFLRFDSLGMSITFIKPDRVDGIPELLDVMTKDTFFMAKLRKKLKTAYLKISVPRLKIKTYVDWTDFLRMVGLNKILSTDNRGLDGMLKNGAKTDIPVHVSIAKQKVFFELNEIGLSRYVLPLSGSEALRELMEMEQTQYQIEEFTLDQPFYFVVNMESSGIYNDMFNGVVRKPDPV